MSAEAGDVEVVVMVVRDRPDHADQMPELEPIGHMVRRVGYMVKADSRCRRLGPCGCDEHACNEHGETEADREATHG